MVTTGTTVKEASRTLLAAGAASASMLWFFSLAIGGARLAPLLCRPVTWRVIDLLVAAMMLRVAWTLAAPVWS